MGWPLVPLHKVAKPVRRPETPQPGTTYRRIGVRLWGRGAYLRDAIDGSATKYPALYRVRKDDIIVNKIWARNGSVAVVTNDLDGSVGSSEFPTYEVDKAALLPEWFAWFTRTPGLWAQCNNLSRGTSGQNRLRPERFLDVRLPLPPPDEQRNITLRLNKVAALVEEACFLREKIDRDALSLVENVHFERSEPSERAFGDFIESWEDRVSVEPTRSYPQIGLRAFAGGLFFKDSIEASETTYKTFTRLHDGLFVVSQPKGWEGAVAVCDGSHEGWYASPEYRTFRCRPGRLETRYLAALLPTRWFQQELTKLTRGQGARRERLRPEMLLDMKVRMPAIENQYEILSQLKGLCNLRILVTDARCRVDSVIPSVLHRFFSDADTRLLERLGD